MTSPMPSIRKSTVLRLSVAGAILLAGMVAYPLARDSWQDLQSRRAQEREFVAADDLDQQAIVRALLIRELAMVVPCAPSVACPAPVIHFDRNTATLRPLSGAGPWTAYEVRSALPMRSLVDTGDASLPPPLRELLQRLVQRSAVNADPALPGIVYVSDPALLPPLGTPHACDGPRGPMLVRISRAAVQASQGMALALVVPTYCDRSGNTWVARLQRNGTQWQVVE